MMMIVIDDDDDDIVNSQLLSFSGLSDSADVELQTPEAPEDVVDGGDVELACAVDGSGDIRVEWFR